MELQFEKTAWPCLMTVAAQAKQEEQTQEVRLGDQMPDIGRVLGAWGQVLLRGKEWRSTGMTVSTGVMVWVLYAPEDGSEPRLVETWIPVQLKWEFPETNHDGSILANCLLSMVDARSVSARKLMVRTVVSVLGEAWMMDHGDVWLPGQVPEDVHLLKRKYPICLPREAGEKSFAIEETVSMPSAVEQLIRYSLRPEIVDTNVVAGKVVFRGNCRLHVLYIDQEGELHTYDQEFHFSQFADLDGELDGDTQVRVVPAVTNLELDVDELGQLQLKAGLLGQFVVSEQKLLEVVEDAYSNRRAVNVMKEAIQLPAQLDQATQTQRFTADENMSGERMVDLGFLCGHPRGERTEAGMNLEQSGVFQLLYRENGTLKGTTIRADSKWEIPAGDGVKIVASAVPVGDPQGTINGSRVDLRGDVEVHTVTTAEHGINAVTGLNLGEMVQPDPDRPSMILKRSGGQSLWELAKSAGSTMEDITKINQLQGEPEDDRLLLIPVL